MVVVLVAVVVVVVVAVAVLAGVVAAAVVVAVVVVVVVAAVEVEVVEVAVVDNHCKQLQGSLKEGNTQTVTLRRLRSSDVESSRSALTNLSGQRFFYHAGRSALLSTEFAGRAALLLGFATTCRIMFLCLTDSLCALDLF